MANSFRYEFNVEDGDVIMLATDGIFDNVPTSLLVDQISSNIDHGTLSACGSGSRCTDEEYARACEDVALKLQQCANSIALIARKLSQVRNRD